LLTHAVMVVLSTSLALVLAELLLRGMGTFDLGIWGVTREGLVVLRPDQCTELRSASQRVCANSLGLRDVEHPVAKPAGAFRILVLGDSFMEAVQVSLEDSFARRLERLHAADGRAVEVINAGISGWGTDDQLAYLRLYGSRFRPDLVLVGMTLHNDVSDNLSSDWYEFRDGQLLPQPVPLFSAFDYRRLQVQTFLAAHSQIYQALFRAWRARDFSAGAKALDAYVANLVSATQAPDVARGWAKTEALFDELTREASAAGARSAVFLIPLWIQVDPARLEDFRARHPESGSLALRAPQERMIAWGARARVPVIDLQAAFAAEQARGVTLYLERDGHWTPAGHLLAADEVGRQLEALGIARAGRM
jgi:hypothetical protein